MRHDITALSPARVMTTPARLLWGELDRYLGPWMVDDLGPWAPRLRVRRFSTAGHWLKQQMLEQVNAELLSFLRTEDA
jgi:pimeloyl-ACP methyl ester carboxylesterase